MRKAVFYVALVASVLTACGKSGSALIANAGSQEELRDAIQRFHDGLSNADTSVIKELVADNAVFLRQGRLESPRELVYVHGPTLVSAHGRTGHWRIRDVRMLDGNGYAVTEPREATSGNAFGLTMWRWNRRWQIVAGHWSHQ